MSLFGPKIIDIIVTNTKLAKLIKTNPHYLAILYVFHTRPNLARGLYSEAQELLKIGHEEVLNGIHSPVRDYDRWLHFLLTYNIYLYRCINPRDYRTLLETGNTKQEENISADEEYYLKKHTLDSRRVMFASTYPQKAWEYSVNREPIILIVYYKRFFELAPGDQPYLWQIKKGVNFRDTIAAIIFIKCPL